jgi:capsular exopolysaccharide synthesis family protein
MADLGLKTLLIDTDLRNSTMRTDYELSTHGIQMKDIAHFLAGQTGIQDVIYSTSIDNAYIIPVVNNLANPSMLLEKKRFGQMIEACRNTFDYVIVDTPPLGAVADALTISTHCDGALLVVRAGETSRKVIQQSINMLKPTKIPLLGIALNRVKNAQRGNKYYGGYARYGEYYNKK